MKTKRFFFSLLVGITLAFVFMAFQTFFYLSAKRYGAWSPAEVPYSEILNTAFPWMFVIFAGFTPAVIEEFTFRMFSIPFIEKVSKSKVVTFNPKDQLPSPLVQGGSMKNEPRFPDT